MKRNRHHGRRKNLIERLLDYRKKRKRDFWESIYENDEPRMNYEEAVSESIRNGSRK